MWIENFSGESAALTAALFWACATVSFGRMGRVLHPLEMNLVKNLVAIAMLVITLAPGGQLLAGLPMQASLLFILPIAAAIAGEPAGGLGCPGRAWRCRLDFRAFLKHSAPTVFSPQLMQLCYNRLYQTFMLRIRPPI